MFEETDEEEFLRLIVGSLCGKKERIDIMFLPRETKRRYACKGTTNTHTKGAINTPKGNAFACIVFAGIAQCFPTTYESGSNIRKTRLQICYQKSAAFGYTGETHTERLAFRKFDKQIPKTQICLW